MMAVMEIGTKCSGIPEEGGSGSTVGARGGFQKDVAFERQVE